MLRYDQPQPDSAYECFSVHYDAMHEIVNNLLEVSVLLEIIIDSATLTIPIAEAFKPDIDDVVMRMEQFAALQGADIATLDVRGLIPSMIRGIVGCERGCPADAKGLISRGYKGFDLQYIEGGILTGRAMTADGRHLYIKMFPDF